MVCVVSKRNSRGPHVGYIRRIAESAGGVRLHGLNSLHRLHVPTHCRVSSESTHGRHGHSMVDHGRARHQGAHRVAHWWKLEAYLARRRWLSQGRLVRTHDLVAGSSEHHRAFEVSECVRYLISVRSTVDVGVRCLLVQHAIVLLLDLLVEKVLQVISDFRVIHLDHAVEAPEYHLPHLSFVLLHRISW